jgi:hypothetical protein
MVEFEAVSSNISICGLLLEASSLIRRHIPVSFTVTVNHHELGRRIQFVGEGRVVGSTRRQGKTSSLSWLSVKGRSLKPTLIPQLEVEVDSRLFSLLLSLEHRARGLQLLARSRIHFGVSDL